MVNSKLARKPASHRHFSKRLSKVLSRARTEEFLRLIWDVDAIQARTDVGHRQVLLNAPAEVWRAKQNDPLFIHKWSLETLTNKFLATPQETPHKTGRARRLNCRDWNAFRNVYNLLHGLENADDKAFMEKYGVSRLMGPLAHRQFPWQRGIEHTAYLYRNAFIYSGDAVNATLVEKIGLTTSDFMLFGFAAWVNFLSSFRLSEDAALLDPNLMKIGLTPELVELGLAVCASPIQEARKSSADNLRHAEHMSYTKSVLRERPIFRSAAAPGTLVCPLPGLVLNRTTSGIFYDIRANSNARNESASRYETYCLEYLRAMLPSVEFVPEITFGPRRARKRSPDILGFMGGKLKIVIECKARRIPFEAKFEDHDLDNLHEAYGEIRKGVRQIWGFAEKIRTGQIEGQRPLADDAVGLVLTLDNWLEADPDARGRMFAGAHAEMDQSNYPVASTNRIPVTIASIEDLEGSLGSITEATFFDAINQVTTGERIGWNLQSALSNAEPRLEAPQRYPFTERVSELLPWWGLIGDADN